MKMFAMAAKALQMISSTFILMSSLILTFPLDGIIMDVLRILNVTPIQFHPNSWAAMQAFRLPCKMLNLKASAQNFLYFYCTRPENRVGWLSLVGQPKQCVLAPYIASYKHFKEWFFRVGIEEEGRKYFYDGDTPRFSFYWTNTPAKISSWSKAMMPEEEQRTISILEGFSNKLPTRKLLDLYMSSRPMDEFDGKIYFIVYC